MAKQNPSQRISAFETIETAVEDPEQTVLSIEGVSKSYGPEKAVEELSLSVKDGELLTLLGPSGCGKTTTLRMIAGLEEPSTGSITIAGETVTADADGPFRKPEERDVGIVFQDYALFPHLDVAQNIAFGLDELDLRVEMREEVRRILKRAGVTAISVTHDQEEALSISDRVAIMNDGAIAQVGNPGEVFENPESRFVATFLGQASFLSARVTDRLETGLGSFDLERLNGPIEAYDGAMIDVLVRPDDLQALPTSEPKADGYVVHRQYNGPSFIYRVELHSGDVVHCMHNHVETFEAGQPVEVDMVADHELAWYPAE